ncbi:MAG: diadenylate cyclase CdaA [Clostridia bacterium]|nr:diadenylate cyclase CdaA [Clostridia bacterium]
MNELITTVRNMFWNVTHRLGIADVIDIIIVAVVIYELIMLLRHTRGSALIKGLIVFCAAALASSLLGFTSLNWLLTTILNNGAIVLIILFQPELRKALESMGRSKLFDSRKKTERTTTNRITNEIVQCLLDLSRRRVGALLVFERLTGLQDVVDTGTAVDAEISAPLIENIFEPNTPLHDGAVVITGERIAAAACILPLTEASGVSLELGTRHRAAIGISENTDALVLVVSEETGTISMAKHGELERPMNEEKLREVLGGLYEKENSSLLSFVTKLIQKKEETADDE